VSTASVTAETLERERPLTAHDASWRADWIRLQTIDLIDQPGLGHYSSTFSCAELLSVLYYHTMRIRPADPQWADRDRFMFGKGHATTGLWPILADLGYFPSDWLKEFGSVGARLNDHPNMRVVPGIDFSSGSLGHNLSVGVGMALAARIQGRDYRTFLINGDGELQEGQVWEAIMAASHYRLGNLISIVDANGFSGGGPTSEAMNIEPLMDRFTAFGWAAQEIDGHDTAALLGALDGLANHDSDRPQVIIARTQKGRGVSFAEAAPQAWHLGHMEGDMAKQARNEIEARMQ
jgi:transketolase